MKFYPAPEVQAVALPLIRDYHRHLFDVRVEYLFVDKTPKSKGAEVWGYCRKISGLGAFLARRHPDDVQAAPDEAFFVVVIAFPVWEQLDAAQRTALVDHELCHTALTDDGQVTLRNHDVEEFHEIIRRHGLWSKSTQRLAHVMEQGELFGKGVLPSMFEREG